MISKSKIVSIGAFVIALISFFLPLFSASAFGFELSVTGIDMSFGLDLDGYGRAGGDMICLLLLALPAIAIILNLVIKNNKIAGSIAVVAAVINVAVALSIKSYILDQLGFAAEMLNNGAGYYGIIIFSIAAAVAGVAGLVVNTSPSVAVKKVEGSPKPVSTGKKFCTECGAEISGKDTFCSECGASVQ